MKTSLYTTLRPVLRFCGSIKLAMLLLTVIIIASIAGTLVESRLDTEVAQAYVYDAPWFIAWLILLCVNLIGAVVVRYPWKPHQIGFVITHGGIVVIMIGALIGRIWGIEGNMTLIAGGAPQDFVVVNQTVLQVQSGHSGETKTFPVNLTMRPPAPERPLVLEKGDFRISVIKVAEELGTRTAIEPGETRGVPAMRLVMNSSMAPHPIEQWLLLDDPRRGVFSVGRNIIRFTAEKNPRDAQLASDTSLAREVHFSFSRMPEVNLSRLVEGRPSGATAMYHFPQPGRAAGDLGILEITTGGEKFELPVAQSLARTVELPGTDWTLRGLQYFADFRMDGRQIVSASDEPNNPALVFELVGPPSGSACCSNHEAAEVARNDEDCPHSGEQAGGYTQGASPHGAHGPHGGKGRENHGNELTIIYRDGQLRYVASSVEGIVEGEIEPGAAFTPGWGWNFEVTEFLEKAVLREIIGPKEEPGMRALNASGLLVQIENGENTVERWIQMGTTAFVSLGSEHLHLGFGYRLHPLGFKVALERFEVEFNEGTTTPASFKSHVRFTDKASGETLTRQVWMNNPANFPYYPGVGFLGTAYKFSQSSWNPGNLNQSTLQVIRDPGWLFKWIGSLVFCLGLVTIFYIKPYPRRSGRKAPSSGFARSAAAATSGGRSLSGVNAAETDEASGKEMALSSPGDMPAPLRQPDVDRESMTVK